MKNIKKWVKRYWRAEIAGTITAIISASLTYLITNNYIFSAVAGTLGENLGFYGVMILRDVNTSKKLHKRKSKDYNFTSFIKNLRDILFEFGPAEILDTYISRPLMMYIFPKLIGNIELGILVGKIVADIIVYIPVVISYEIQQRYKKKHLDF